MISSLLPISNFSKMALPPHKLGGVLFVLLYICATSCHGLHRCHPKESQALLLFKARLNDSLGTLNSWLNGTDCCTWYGISCHLRTNHVLTLNITWNAYPGLHGGVISNSLCDLRYLTHLQLDGNRLTGTLPLCLGNLSHLQYLDLGYNNLSGTIPPLRNLSHLQYLDLGYNNLSGTIPPTICLTNLTDLDLSNNKLNGSLPACMGELSSLTSLPLRVGNLSHLRYLDLDNNNLSGPHRCRPQESQALLLFKARLNDSWGTLDSWLNGTDCCMWHGISCDLLTNHVLTLNITESLEGGVMSDSLCDLRSLTHVELQNNQLTGTLPLCLGNLSHLQYLDLSYNYYLSGTVPPLGNHSPLQHLHLGSNNLSGTIPPTICLLANLYYLDVSANQLIGSLPSYIGNLSSLSSLDISSNQLNGNIPESLGYLSSLSYLDISYNQLKGNIPHSLGNLSLLFYLSISHNLLSGTVPSSIAKLSSLKILYAHDNAFNETIPALPTSIQYLYLSLNNNQTISETIFHNLTKLNYLYLSNCVLNISTTWIPSFQLQRLYLVSCKINGQIPLWISTQFLIESLTLADNNLSGEILSWLWESSSSLQSINLTANHLQGRLFTNSSMWMQLSTLDVSKNLLSGYLPSLWSPSTTWLQLNDNLFTGNVPSSLGNLSNLLVLNLANNHLNGIIPLSLVNCSSLEVLNLGNNSLKGQMPYEFGRLKQLQSLVVRNNKLKGLFPPSMANCTNLQFLDIGDNLFNGEIPKFIGNLSLLKVLVMEGNYFSGNIPSEIGQLTELHILHLSSNSLSGFIPPSILSLQAMTTVKEDGFMLPQITKVFNMFTKDILFEGLHMVTKGIDLQYPYIRSELISIDLSNNKLEGVVPSDFGKLNGLMSLNLSMNYLNGCIPNSLGKLSQLESLDLSSNRLSGKIPGELESLDYLEVLNLSNNRLSGSIPQGKKLYLLPNSSYIGNPDLWGCPLPKNCTWPQFARPPPIAAIKRQKSIEIPWYEITLGLSYGVGFGVTTLLIVVRMSWKKKYFEKVDVMLKFLFPWLNKWTL